jgi:hypothetical protein
MKRTANGMMRPLRVLVVVIGAAAASAAAPGIQLSISDGRVWLGAEGATPGQILAEWARVGSTRVVNGEGVAGGPMTLEMRGVPELEVLDVVLRSTGGFIAAERTPGGTPWLPNLSRFDRIVVLPAGARPADRSTRPADPPIVTPPTVAPPSVLFDAAGRQRIIGPDGQPIPDDQEGAPPPSPSVPSNHIR